MASATSPSIASSSKIAKSQQKPIQSKANQKATKEKPKSKIVVEKEIENPREKDESISDWRQELDEQLESFSLNEDVRRLEFSTALLAHQRAYVHEVRRIFYLEVEVGVVYEVGMEVLD